MREGSDVVGKRIREQRERLRITQTELADRLGIARHNMNFYERGSRSPSFQLLVKLAKTLGVSTDWLLGCSEKPGLFPDEEVASVLEDFAGLSPRDRLVVREIIKALRKVEVEELPPLPR